MEAPAVRTGRLDEQLYPQQSQAGLGMQSADFGLALQRHNLVSPQDRVLGHENITM